MNILILGINILGFILMGYDKSQAIRKGWRIQERTLLLISILGGGIGVYIAMVLFRHKTQKKIFRLGVPFIFLLQLGLLFFYQVNGTGI